MRTVQILAIEDNPGDIRLTREALSELGLDANLTVITDGEAAVMHVQACSARDAEDRPDLILLDLNIPKRDGAQVLDAIKQSPTLCRVPVVILTTSRRDADVRRMYEKHANAYVTKPISLDGYIATLREIVSFWTSVVTLPRR